MQVPRNRAGHGPPTDRADQAGSGGSSDERLIERLSHELRTPITTIYGGSKLLRRGPRFSGEVRREIEEAVEVEAERLYNTVENLLAVAGSDQPRAGGAQPVSLQRVLRRLAETARELRPDIAVALVLPGSVPPVAGEEDAISHVLRNVLSNAVRFAPAGSTVEIVLAADEGRATVRVLDRGPGLDPGEIERLFEPFYRSSRTATVAPGAGLGLPACRRLVTAMGGGIDAAPRPGGGAEFTVALPIHPSD